MSGRKPGEGAQPRRDRLIREQEHDPYKVRGKLPDPSACSDCRAMFRAGRWTWGSPPVDAHVVVCPACQRIRDDYPAGYLTLEGDFPVSHRVEVLGLARNVEEREKREHPLKRLMDIVEDADEIRITTTDSGLARNIGDALEAAYEGELDYQYTKEGSCLRVTWRR
jgi:hypothetical protein